MTNKKIIDFAHHAALCHDAGKLFIIDTIFVYGRSYSSGITMDKFISELEEGCVTRYAPWLSELFSKKDVRSDLEYILKEGREIHYRNTYHLLKNVHEKP